MVRFIEEDLQKVKKEDPELYRFIMDYLKEQEERLRIENEITNRFWSMVEASENKDKRR